MAYEYAMIDRYKRDLADEKALADDLADVLLRYAPSWRPDDVVAVLARYREARQR